MDINLNLSLTSFEVSYLLDLLDQKIDLSKRILACKASRYDCESEIVSQEVYLESQLNLRSKIYKQYIEG